jgi:hypothetical protein
MAVYEHEAHPRIAERIQKHLKTQDVVLKRLITATAIPERASTCALSANSPHSSRSRRSWPPSAS